jgi:hypothetical protein
MGDLSRDIHHSIGAIRSMTVVVAMAAGIHDKGQVPCGQGYVSDERSTTPLVHPLVREYRLN